MNRLLGSLAAIGVALLLLGTGPGPAPRAPTEPPGPGVSRVPSVVPAPPARPAAGPVPSEVPARWIEICAGGPTSGFRCDPQPPKLVGATIAYDPKTGGTLLFGGQSPGVSAPTNNTYTYAPNSDLSLIWSQDSPLGAVPPARTNASMVFDSTDGYVLLFGGWDPADGRVYDDTWSWDPTIPAWQPVLTPAGVLGRFGACLMDVPFQDGHGGYELLFGGATAPGTAAADLPTSTWEYSAGSWTNVTASAGGPPTGRAFAACAYDASAGYGVLFGGLGAGGASLNDTWEWDPSTGSWLERTANGTAGSPSPRFAAEATYAAYDGDVVLFGGARGPWTSPLTLPPDTWLFANGSWSNATGSVPYETLPVMGDYGGAATDTPFGYALFFGGATAIPSYANATWAFGELMLGSLAPNANEIVLGQSVTFYANVSGGTGANWTTSYADLPPGCASANVTQLTCTPSAPGGYDVQATLADPTGVTNVTNAVPLVVDPGGVVGGRLSEGSRIYAPPAAFLGADLYFNRSLPAAALARRLNATGATLDRFYGDWDTDNVSAGLTYSQAGVPSSLTNYNLSTYAALCDDLGPRCHASIGISAQTNDSGMMVANLRYDLRYLPDPTYLEIGTEVNNWHHFDLPFSAWNVYDNVAPTPLQYALEVRQDAPLLRALAPEAQIQAQLSAFFTHYPSRALWYAQNLSRYDCGTVATITIDLYPNNHGYAYLTPQVQMRNVSTLSVALAELHAAILAGNASCDSMTAGISENNVAGQGATAFAALNDAWSTPYVAAQFVQALQGSASMYGYWAFIEDGGFGNGAGSTFSLINASNGATSRNYLLFEMLKGFDLDEVCWANVSAPMRGIYAIEGVDGGAGRSYLVVNTNTTTALDLSTSFLAGDGEGLDVEAIVPGSAVVGGASYPEGGLPSEITVPAGGVFLIVPANVTAENGVLEGFVIVGALVGVIAVVVLVQSRRRPRAPGGAPPA